MPPDRLTGRKLFFYLIERKMQPLQNLCPQVVCTGSRSPKRQIGHLYLLSKGGSKYLSYPSDDEESLLENALTVLGSNDASRKSDDCSSRRKERAILLCFLCLEGLKEHLKIFH